MNLTATLFGQIISFALLVWFVNRVLWKPLTGAMASRAERIADGLRSAERAKTQEMVAQKEAAKILKQARSRAADIIQQAHSRRAAIFESTFREAQETKDRMIANAEEEIERMTDRAREQLRRELAGLVLEGAGMIALAEMDAAHHNDLIHDLTARI